MPDVPEVQTPRAAEMRQRRAQARRRAAALGNPYDDRMASDPLMTRETTIETDAHRPAELGQPRVVNIGGST